MLVALWLAETRQAPHSLAARSDLHRLSSGPRSDRVLARGTPESQVCSPAAYRDVITPRDTALLLPVGISGYSMLWQAEAGLRFKMASGYVVPPEAPDPYKTLPGLPDAYRRLPVPDEIGAAEFFLYTHHVTVAVVDPSLAAGGAVDPDPRAARMEGAHGGRCRRAASRARRQTPLPNRTAQVRMGADSPSQNPVQSRLASRPWPPIRARAWRATTSRQLRRTSPGRSGANIGSAHRPTVD